MAASSSKRDSQPCFAAAGHPHAHCMRSQVLRLVKHQFRRDLLLLQVKSLTQVKEPELFKVLHVSQSRRGVVFLGLLNDRIHVGWIDTPEYLA